jgi:CBS domain containing-hemolysin-like protein
MIAPIYQTLGNVLVMLLLVAGAALFSGSETAFFNLTQRQVKQLEESPVRLQKLAARLPVWQNTPSEIVGFIEVYDVLGSGEEFTSLEKFLLPIRSLDADTSITDAINIMRREQRRIVLVTRRRGGRDGPLGIVTMKDLVEELLGELAEW